QVDDDRLALGDRAATHVVPDRALRAAGDDELVGGRVVRHKRLGDRALDQLDRERSAVDLEAVSVRLRPAPDVARRTHAGLGRLLRAAHAGQLGPALRAAAVVEVVAVGRQLDPFGAEDVSNPEWERLRDDRRRDAEPGDGTNEELLADLRAT